MAFLFGKKITILTPLECFIQLIVVSFTRHCPQIHKVRLGSQQPSPHEMVPTLLDMADQNTVDT